MKPKKECEICGKLIRTCHLKKNRLNNKLMCKVCFNRIGENKFFIPKSNKRISRFKITDDERKVLAISKGWKKVNEHCIALRTIGQMKKRQDKENLKSQMIEKINKEKLKKDFLEGLK